MSGRPPTVSDQEILERLAAEEEFDFMFTSELRDELGFDTNSGIQKRLEGLEREGLVRAKRGSSANAWLLTDAGWDRIEGGE